MVSTDPLVQARDALSVKRVFGDPYEKDGVTLVPAALVMGGGGGGSDAAGNGGSGFGLVAFPVGAYVIKDGAVSWRPALNVNVAILAGAWMLRTLARARRRRRR